MLALINISFVTVGLFVTFGMELSSSAVVEASSSGVFRKLLDEVDFSQFAV